MVRAVLAGAALCAACSSPGDPVARSIAVTVERELGVKPRAVRCHGAACELTLPDGTAIPVQVEGGRDVVWATAELVDPAPIVVRVVDELARLGATQTVDCGPLRLAPLTPVTIECQLGGGGAAWATVDLTGAIDVELALTAAAASARRDGPGDGALEAMSRALDSDEAQGGTDDPAHDDDDHDGVDGSPDASTDGAAAPTRGLGG